MQVDMSWWPILTVPFPYVENGLVLDLTWINDVLAAAGRVVGPLLVFVAVFFAVRGLVVNWRGGGGGD